MRQNSLRVGVVGCGRWGREHVRAFAQQDHTKVCAVVDTNFAAATTVAAACGATPYTDVASMIETERLDFISVAVSNGSQYDPTMTVIQAGIPLMAEKPLAFALEDADRLIAEANARNLFFAIDFNHRYAHPMMLARDAIRAGRIGEPLFAIWRFGGEHSGTEHPYANIIETQCHGFDMLEHLCGPIESVMAEMTDKTGAGLTTMVISVRFENGAVGSLIGTYDSSYQYMNVNLLEVNGSLAHVVVEDTVRRFTFQRKGDEMREVWESSYYNDVDRNFRKILDRHLEQVLAAFRHNSPPPIHASAGRRALALALDAIESFETGRRVRTGSRALPTKAVTG